MAGRYLMPQWKDNVIIPKPITDQELGTWLALMQSTPMLEVKFSTLDIVRLILEVQESRRRLLALQTEVNNLNARLDRIAGLLEDR